MIRTASAERLVSLAAYRSWLSAVRSALQAAWYSDLALFT